MRPDIEGLIRVIAEPLTAARFAPFGDVIEAPREDSARTYVSAPFADAEPGATPRLWVNRIGAARPLPLRLACLERHPYSAQTFIPMQGGRYLVIGCADAGDLTPDLATLRAFIAEPHQGITYRRNAWHHPMTLLDGPGAFSVAMSHTGRGDDVFIDLAMPVDVLAPGGVAPGGVPPGDA